MEQDNDTGNLYFSACDDLVVPLLTELVRVEGKIDYDGPHDTPVRNLVFRGLTFTQGDRLSWH